MTSKNGSLCNNRKISIKNVLWCLSRINNSWRIGRSLGIIAQMVKESPHKDFVGERVVTLVKVHEMIEIYEGGDHTQISKIRSSKPNLKNQNHRKIVSGKKKGQPKGFDMIFIFVFGDHCNYISLFLSHMNL